MTQTLATPARTYADGFEHLTDHLRALDEDIAHAVALMRATSREDKGPNAFNDVLISDTEVDRLLAGGTPPLRGTTSFDRRHADVLARAAASTEAGIDLPLAGLCRAFGLNDFETRALVICMAPEINRKYDRLYAYLQDDASRKRPSIDLILTLLCDTAAQRWDARVHLTAGGTLRRAGILRVVEDEHSPSGSTDLATFLRLDERIRHHLQGHPTVDAAVADAVAILKPTEGLDRTPVEESVKAQLAALVDAVLSDPEPRRLVVELRGPAGVGRRRLAEGLCADLGCALVVVRTDRWCGRGREISELLKTAFREGLLHQGMVYLDGIEAVQQADGTPSGTMAAVADAASTFSALTFVAAENHLRLDGVPANVRFHRLDVPRPGVAVREGAWRSALQSTVPTAETSWARPLAARFSLTPQQIDDAALDAQLTWDSHNKEPKLRLADLTAACRRQCEHQLDDVAVRITSRRTWDDLTLPDPQLAQLAELCARVRNGHQVYDTWGFGRLTGRGVSALLVGVPGTGKTLSAEVVAGDLGVDLFAVNLSAVVSKYIGETEKNLSRIFAAAEHSNGVLFFDEADALFGKRTEVSDAHDRYANIETSYLLQRLEQYDGVVILATNLRENIDEAFTRRLSFIVEFPFPDAASRVRIWRSHLPADANVAADIDLEILARAYPLSGAGIRNAALAAAFAAADGGTAIGPPHLRHGIRREYDKIGKLWGEPLPELPAPEHARGGGPDAHYGSANHA